MRVQLDVFASLGLLGVRIALHAERVAGHVPHLLRVAHVHGWAVRRHYGGIGVGDRGVGARDRGSVTAVTAGGHLDRTQRNGTTLYNRLLVGGGTH